MAMRAPPLLSFMLVSLGATAAATATFAGGNAVAAAACRHSPSGARRVCTGETVLMQRSNRLLDARKLALQSTSERFGSSARMDPLELLSDVRSWAASRVAASAARQGDTSDSDAALANQSSVQAAALQRVLDGIEGEISSDMAAEHKNDQAEVDNSSAAIAECSQTLDAEKVRLQGTADAIADEEMKVTACESKVEALRQASSSACAAAYAFQKREFAAHDCVLGDSMTPAALWQNVRCVEEFASDLGAAIELTQLCNSSTHEYEGEEKQCTAVRDAGRQAVCNLERETSDVCSAYTSCHTGASQRFRDLEANLRALEAGRKAHAVAVEKIKCLLRTVLLVDEVKLSKNGTGQANLEACDALSGEEIAESFTIAYPIVPQVAECPWKAWSQELELQCTLTTSGAAPDNVETTPLPDVVETTQLPTTSAPLAETTSSADLASTTTSTPTKIADPLLPTAAIRLHRDGSSVTWGSGLQPSSSASTQSWHLRKCSGTDASSCLGKNEAWTSTTSAIVSGDVVAWENDASGKVYDCAGASCSQQPFPPPSGHWGTPFRIFKVDAAGEAAAAGTPISLGDSVYFYGMQSSRWAPGHIINCGETQCGGSASNTISGSLFSVLPETF
eukprot:CAMPEP_0179067916 /NCGR_PEP_ID=MMETSP0796-20121207/29739_1 /TAXON_ID=73915 /ORGANISM="Pyrodinium bahamense, Strain pbaha01" /LENGTH=620 /DNA_ID=CAMNT_0020764967 /DNA_START=1 /DNA_END=1863 /DNA_ORIENTATION=+